MQDACSLTHSICFKRRPYSQCPKCEPGKGRVLPLNPLDVSSVWTCHDVHSATALSSKNTQQLQLDLQRDMYKNGLEISSMQQLETQIGMLTDFLHPHHGLLLAAKRSLIQCFSQIPANAVDRKHLELVKNLCLQQLHVSDQVMLPVQYLHANAIPCVPNVSNKFKPFRLTLDSQIGKATY